MYIHNISYSEGLGLLRRWPHICVCTNRYSHVCMLTTQTTPRASHLCIYKSLQTRMYIHNIGYPKGLGLLMRWPHIFSHCLLEQNYRNFFDRWCTSSSLNYFQVLRGSWTSPALATHFLTLSTKTELTQNFAVYCQSMCPGIMSGCIFDPWHLQSCSRIRQTTQSTPACDCLSNLKFARITGTKDWEFSPFASSGITMVHTDPHECSYHPHSCSARSSALNIQDVIS